MPTAFRYAERFAPYDPYWIEEPFSPDQIENHAKLAAMISIPVATGEIEAGRWRFKELLDKQAASILQADAAVCGGITEFRRIAALADAYGVTMCPHWFHDLHVHLVAASPNGQFVEYFPDGKVFNFCEIIDRQLEVRNGGLALPTGPGLGYLFDEKAIARFQATRGVGPAHLEIDAGNHMMTERTTVELDPKTIATLSAVATATLTTVLLKKGLRNVWLRGTKPLRPGQKRLVGPAFTLRFVPAREDLATPESWSSPISTRAAIEAMAPGCIAVVGAMGITDAGIFGDILCARMKVRGVARPGHRWRST